MKRIFALVITAAMVAGLFAGCGNPAGSNSGKVYAMKNFAAKNNGSILTPAVDSKGNVVVASQADGGPVEIVTYDPLGSVLSQVTTDVTESASNFTMDKNDTVYIIATSGQNVTDTNVYKLDSSGKTANKIPIGSFLNQGMMIGGPGTQSHSDGPDPQTTGGQVTDQQTTGGQKETDPQAGGDTAPGRKPGAGMGLGILGFAVSSDGSIFLSVMGGGGAIQLDSTGKQVRSYSSGPMNLICLDENEQLLVYSARGSSPSLTTYNIQDGSQVNKTDVSASFNSMFYDKQNKQLICMSSDGIAPLKPDGSAGAPIITLNDHYTDSSTRGFTGFVMDASGSIFITSSDQTGFSMTVSGPGGGGGSISFGTASRIDLIALAEASSLTQKKTLTVAGLSGDGLLDAAITEFQTAHPDYKIDLKTYDNQVTGVGKGPQGESQKDLTPLIQQFNTDIIAGNSADVYILDNLPYYKYIEDGLLADLGPMMSSSNMDMSQYYSNIFDACKTDGKQYVIPAAFTYEVLAGKQANLPSVNAPSFDNFLNTVNSLPAGVAVFPQEEAASAFESFMRDSYSYFVDQTTKTAKFNTPDFIKLLNEFKSLMDTRMSAKSAEKQIPVEQVSNGDLAFVPMEVTGFQELAAQIALADGDLSFTSMPSIQPGSYGFLANDLAGINASSQNKDMAWEFIKTLLSESVQSARQQNGFQVNKAACQSIIDQMNSGDFKAMIATPNKQVEVKPLTDDQLASVQDMLGKLNTLIAPDANVVDILNEELPAFFSGQKSAEDTASVIQNRVQTILNE